MELGVAGSTSATVCDYFVDKIEVGSLRNIEIMDCSTGTSTNVVETGNAGRCWSADPLHRATALRAAQPDSRLKCGLFRQSEPNGQAQEWHDKSSKVLSLAEARFLKREMKLLVEWLAASRQLNPEERKSAAKIKDGEDIDWSKIQLGLKEIGYLTIKSRTAAYMCM